MARLLVLFFASGCAALIYETVWFYLVQLVVGASSISVAVLLCAFMGGMALGSWLLPKLTPKGTHPFKVVAALEAGIAMLGIAIPLALPYIQQVYLTLAEPGAGAIIASRGGVLLVLTPPTMLMGATLPAIARWHAPRARRTIGRLALHGESCRRRNRHGRRRLLSVARLRHGDRHNRGGRDQRRRRDRVLADGHAARTQRRGTVAPDEPRGSRRTDESIMPIYVTAALSGFTALGAEVVWTRQLSLLFGASVYTFSLILAVFLAGLGIGGLAGTALSRRVQRGERARTHPGPARRRHCVRRVRDRERAAAVAADVVVPPARAHDAVADVHVSTRCDAPSHCCRRRILWGASFPLTLAAGRTGDFGGHVARINAINTAGALAGAIAFTLIGIPRLGSHDAQQALVIGAAVSSLRPAPVDSTARRAADAWRIVAVVTALALWIVPAVPGQLIAYGRSVNSWDSIARFLYLAEGATASVAVTEHTGGARQFHIAGKVEASDMDIDMRLERMLGHVPALLHPNPRSVLIVGVGAGVTAGALSIHPEVERIVICEIEPVVPRSARAYFGNENHHVFDDPRVQLVFDDARHFLQTTDERFDIITSDPIHPWVRGAATLYSLEYLTLAKNHLTPGGVVTQWIPLYETDMRSVKSEIGTFAKVFPDTTLWNPDLLEEGYDLVALGRAAGDANRRGGDPGAARRARRACKKSLEEVMLKSAADILGSYAGRGRDLAPWLADAQINRERHLRLQYLAGLAANRDQRFVIFEAILGYRRYPADLFVASAETEAKLRSGTRATPSVSPSSCRCRSR